MRIFCMWVKYLGGLNFSQATTLDRVREGFVLLARKFMRQSVRRTKISNNSQQVSFLNRNQNVSTVLRELQTIVTRNMSDEVCLLRKPSFCLAMFKCYEMNSKSDTHHPC